MAHLTEYIQTTSRFGSAILLKTYTVHIESIYIYICIKVLNPQYISFSCTPWNCVYIWTVLRVFLQVINYKFAKVAKQSMLKQKTGLFQKSYFEEMRCCTRISEPFIEDNEKNTSNKYHTSVLCSPADSHVKNLFLMLAHKNLSMII